MSFLGSASQRLSTSAALAVSSPFTSVLVALATVNNSQFINSTTNSAGIFQAQTTGMIFYCGTILQTTGTALNVPTAWVGVQNSAASSINVSRAQPAISGNAGSSALAGTYSIGANNLGVYPTGSVAEHIIYNRQLSQVEISLLMQYFQHRYGIGVP